MVLLFDIYYYYYWYTPKWMTTGPAAGTGSAVTAGVGAAGSGVMSSLQYRVSCSCVHMTWVIGGNCV